MHNSFVLNIMRMVDGKRETETIYYETAAKAKASAKKLEKEPNVKTVLVFNTVTGDSVYRHFA